MKRYRHSASKKPRTRMSSSGMGNWTVLRKTVTPVEPSKVNTGKRVKIETVLTSKLYRQSLKDT